MDNQKTAQETARQKIAAKIKALLAKTVERGCSESEAVAAAIKAAELMAAHNLNVTEAELLSEGFGEDMFEESDHKMFFVRGLLDICYCALHRYSHLGKQRQADPFLGFDFGRCVRPFPA